MINKIKLIDNLFEAAKDDDNILEDILITLNNIEDDLSILVQYFTETI